MTTLPDDTLDDPRFVVRFAGVDGPSPAGCALAGDGRKWTRRSDETDQEFEDRVLGADPSAIYYVFFPIGTDLEEHEHDHRQHEDRRRTLRIASRA